MVATKRYSCQCDKAGRCPVRKDRSRRWGGLCASIENLAYNRVNALIMLASAFCGRPESLGFNSSCWGEGLEHYEYCFVQSWHCGNVDLLDCSVSLNRVVLAVSRILSPICCRHSSSCSVVYVHESNGGIKERDALCCDVAPIYSEMARSYSEVVPG